MANKKAKQERKEGRIGHNYQSKIDIQKERHRERKKEDRK